MQIDEFEELAKSRFGVLSTAESRLVRAARIGELAICGITTESEDPSNDPFKPEGWPPERHVRSVLLRWLCTDRSAKEMVDFRGLRMHGAWVDDVVDLSCSVVPFPIGMVNCVLNDGLNVSFANIGGLDLELTCLPHINADSLTTKESFWMRHCHCIGPVYLAGSRIGGDLALDGTKLRRGPNSGSAGGNAALNGQQMSVRGSVLLRNGFTAEGPVWLVAAKIDGNLECGYGKFLNAPTREDLAGIALALQGAKIGGAILCRRGFRAEGEVQLRATMIGGDFDCSGGEFRNPIVKEFSAGGTAINATGMTVTGSLSFTDSFYAEGRVDLDSAEIKGNLICVGAKFICVLQADIDGTGLAVNAENMKVSGSVQFRDGFEAQGIVWLSGALIGGSVACDGAKFLNPSVPRIARSGLALMLIHANITGGVYLSAGFRAEGVVSLEEAEIGRNLFCDSGQFANPSLVEAENSGTALNLEGARISGSVLLRSGFVAEGQVRMSRAKIGGSLSCDGAKFRNPAAAGVETSGTALDAEHACISGSVLLRAGFVSQGQIRLYRTEVGGSVEAEGAKITNPVQTGFETSGVALSLENARISSNVHLRNDFLSEGQLLLSNCEIGGSLDCGKATLRNPSVRQVERTGLALVGEGLKVDGGVLLRDGFIAEGMVTFYGARFGHTIECDGGRFENPNKEGWPNHGMALSLKHAKVAGSVYLRNGFFAQGGVSLYSTQVGGDLNLVEGRFEALGLINASVDSIFDDEEAGRKLGTFTSTGLPIGALGRDHWPPKKE